MSFYDDGIWDVDTIVDGKYCSASRIGSHPTFGTLYFSIAYVPADKLAFVQFSSGVTTSLPDTGTRKISLYFTDNKGEELDDGWGEREFDFSKIDGIGHLFSTSFSGTQNVEQILSDVASSSAVALGYNDKIFAVANLEGSARVVGKLRECSLQAAEINPDDPFAF